MFITGRFVGLALAGLIPLILIPRPETAWLWCVVMALFLMADVVLAGSPGKVTMERNLPKGVRLGEPAGAELTAFNHSNRALNLSVRDGWQPSSGAQNPSQHLRIPSHEARRLLVNLLPRRRGDLHAHHVTLRSSGPLGLAGRQLTVPLPGVLRVLPPFHSRRHLPSKLRRLRELDGRTAIQLRGAGTEFDSLRDYVRGDDVRSIDWRATARRQTTVVRTWRPERDRRVIIVLDTSRTAAARIDDEPRLDTGIEAALLLAVLAEHGGDRVDFLAFDRRIRAQAGSASKGILLNDLVHAMAPLEAELIEADWSIVPSRIDRVSSHRSLVVLLTSLDSGAVDEGLLPVLPTLTAKHLVVVASVRDPALDVLRLQRTTVADTYRAAAAERALLDRVAVSAHIRQLGGELVDAGPHELPARLADTYIRLKAAGRL